MYNALKEDKDINKLEILKNYNIFFYSFRLWLSKNL